VYSPALVQSSSSGIIFSTFLVAVAFGIYFLLSQDARLLGASILMLILSFVARDYYHLVYAAGGMLVFAILMSLTDFDEGTFRGALYYAGLGTFLSMILYYIVPATIAIGGSGSLESYDMTFAFLVVLPASAFILLEGLKGGFEYDSEGFIALILAFVVAAVLIQIFGVTHLIWGIALKLFGILIRKLTNGFIAVTSFVAGLVIWLDDVVAYFLYHENIYALTYLAPIGAILIGVFLYMEVTE